MFFPFGFIGLLSCLCIYLTHDGDARVVSLALLELKWDAYHHARTNSLAFNSCGFPTRHHLHQTHGFGIEMRFDRPDDTYLCEAPITFNDALYTHIALRTNLVHGGRNAHVADKEKLHRLVATFKAGRNVGLIVNVLRILTRRLTVDTLPV